MSKPIKKAGFRQGIMEISSTKKEEIGTLRILQDGRKFRYAKAGASALSAGKMAVAATIASGHVNQTSVAASIGDKQLTLTVTAGTAIAENQLAGGYLHINDVTGEGYQYAIESNTALAADGTEISINLEEGIKVALTTSSEFTLVHSPWYGTVESDDEESLPVGIAPVAVTAAYYYWAQTGGPAISLVNGTPAVGTMLTLGATPAGALVAINTTLDIDQPICAIAWGTVGVSGEYKPVKLMLD